MAQFGGGNSVSIEMVANHGSIYTVENLDTIKEITDALYLVPGCIPYAVRSLATLSSERYAILNRGAPDEAFFATPLMPQFPRSAADADQIESAVRGNPLLYGVLASKDSKAALILADFRSELPPGARVALATTEPVAIYRTVMAILRRYQRPGITLRAAGTPIIIGWVNSIGLYYVGGAFILFIAIIAGILWYGFRSYSGILLPLRVALLGVLMGFGFYRVLFGHTLWSAAVLLMPFIVVAAGACHSVQFLSRFFYEEYPRLQSVEEAIVSTFVSRLRPMLMSLLCDIVPFAVMALVPFENVRALGIVTVLGLFSLTIDEFLLMIPALSSITMHELAGMGERLHNRQAEGVDTALASAVRRLLGSRRIRASVALMCLLITAGAAWIVHDRTIGQDNAYAVHNYLTRSWRHSDIYLMEQEISRRFGGVYPMLVLVAPRVPAERVLEQPTIIRAIDGLANFLRRQPHVGRVSDVGYPLKLGNQFLHDADVQFFRVPETQGALGEMLVDMADRSPNVYAWLFTNDLSSTVLIVYLDSTNPTVVQHIMSATRIEAARLFHGLPVTLGVAGGTVGIAQAFNQNVEYWLVVGGLLGFSGTFMLSVGWLRSVRLALVLLIPLVTGTMCALAVMAIIGIELNSNAIGALAIASGVGIDSEIYLLFRVREVFKESKDFREALVQGYVKIRRALLVSNGALVLGFWALVPVPLYIGYVGFGMGLVLLLCFIVSGILSPALWWWFGEDTVVGRFAAKAVPNKYEAA